MSYDLMVFEPTAALRSRIDFMNWYDQQTEWGEDHSYNDPAVCSPALRGWFMEMNESFPAMNGPYASGDIANSTATDYSIGKESIYVAFAWSQAGPAFQAMATLAEKHGLGFFDVSVDDGAIVFPGEFDDFAKLSSIGA